MMRFFWLPLMMSLVPAHMMMGQPLPENTDTLRLLLKTAPDDTFKVLLLDELAWRIKDDATEDIKSLLEDGLKLAQRIHFRRGEEKILNQFGLYYQQRGDLDLAEEFYKKSIVIRRELNDIAGLGRSYNNLGQLSKRKGDYLLARDQFESALDYSRQINDKSNEARICSNLGALLKTLGDFDVSLKYYQQAFEIRYNQSPRDTNEIGRTYMGMGGVYESMGQYERADSLYQLALKFFRIAGNNRESASLLNNLGNVAEFRGDFDTALLYYQQSIFLKRVQNEPIELARTIRNTGRVYLILQNFDKAREELLKAQEIFKTSGAKEEFTNTRVDLAELNLWSGKARAAADTLNLIYGGADSTLSVLQKIHLLYLLALSTAREGNLEAAYQWYHKAVMLRKKADSEVNGALYAYDKLNFARARAETLDANNKLLSKDLELSTYRNRMQFILVMALILLMVIVIFAALWRIKLIQNRRKADAAEFEVRNKASEINRMVQENELQLLQTVMITEDKERKRIANDLHDRLGAELASLKLAVNTLFDKKAEAAEVEQRLSLISRTVDSVMTEVRAASHNLESPTLRDFGLKAALEGLRDTLIVAGKYEFELVLHGLESRLDLQTEMSLFVIVKEFVTNTVRHAQARSIAVQIVRSASGLNLTYEDDGKGIKINEQVMKPGLGLQSVYSRVKALGGEIKIDSAESRGTHITIDLPLT